MNKNGRVVSKETPDGEGRKAFRKAGYFTRKGKFGFVRKDGKKTKNVEHLRDVKYNII